MYIGTKKVAAFPMTRAEYNTYRGWELPADENGADEGYLVEYQDGGKPNDRRHAGYISWSPKAQFDAAYRPATGLSFGLAIEVMKKGGRVARAGWNGKGLSLSIVAPGMGNPMTLPFICMHYPMHPASDAAPANHIGATVPWLASQTDMLADDWQVVE